MFERFARSTRTAVTDAVAEAGRRGDRRVGTEHLLLGLLDDPAGVAASVAADRRHSALRAALDALDAEALAAVGIDVTGFRPAPPVRAAPRLLGPARVPFTAAAKETLGRTVRSATVRKAGRIEPEDLLLALLDCATPDPAGELLDRFGVDRAAVRARLTQAA